MGMFEELSCCRRKGLLDRSSGDEPCDVVLEVLELLCHEQSMPLVNIL